jgi:hypothetical protein
MRGLIISVVAMLSAVAAMAQDGAAWWVERLDATLGERYAMKIEVEMMGEEPIEGLFMVDGEDYYITIGIMEVYGDGSRRYEVNNERKEVTIDSVDLGSVDLLTNPTHAFDFVDEEFRSELVSYSATAGVLRLVPRDSALGVSEIEVAMRRDGERVVPTRVTYDYGGDSISIELSAVAWSERGLPRWDKNEYRAYDIVSFL